MDSVAQQASSPTQSHHLSRAPIHNKKSHGNRYSLTKKLAIKALAESGVTPSEIAREEGIGRQTVYDIMKNERIKCLDPKIVGSLKDSLKGYVYANAYRAQNKITEQKLDDMNAYQLTMISAVNIDKGRLMENMSTSNISVLSVAQNVQSELDTLTKQLGDLR
jgi:DNA-binding CsgD family transcriptional regulator